MVIISHLDLLSRFVCDGVLLERISDPDHLCYFVVTLCGNHAILVVSRGRAGEALHVKTGDRRGRAGILRPRKEHIERQLLVVSDFLQSLQSSNIPRPYWSITKSPVRRPVQVSNAILFCQGYRPRIEPLISTQIIL